MMVYEPKVKMNTMFTYRQNCMMGLLNARIFSALVNSVRTSSAAFSNFCFS